MHHSEWFCCRWYVPSYQGKESSDKTAPSTIFASVEEKSGHSNAPQLALKALEQELDEDMFKKFHECPEEEYDVTDPLYTTWVKLKKQALNGITDAADAAKDKPDSSRIILFLK